ncbi:MAG: hypothetical protein COA54_13720 [Thiotrichaceae bacterium]|nr:MAG: hypothetical protein COA54_13720 [Thiotrichaceae bacterium]
MILTAIILYALAASIGIFLIVLGVRYHRSSLKTGLVHASLALIASGFLAAQIINGSLNKFNNVAALLMVLALVGGAMLFGLREPGKAPPMVMVAIHAIMAFAGLSLLIVGYQ